MLRTLCCLQSRWHMLLSAFCEKNRRKLCTEITSPGLVSLSHRSIIQVNGRDSLKLLQGLLTNDMNLLYNSDVIYSMILNIQGRVLYDVMVYNGSMENEYLVECDSIVSDELIAMLKRYQLRSKVTFNVQGNMNIFSLFSGSNKNITQPEEIKLIKDPRLAQLGHRILSEKNAQNVLKKLDFHVNEHSISEYIQLRYKLGISEGVAEVSTAIPLEHNVALLNGVSFTKGCYIGQELVARAHHTGVIRKRIMPLKFLSDSCEIKHGDHIVNQKDKRVGKVIGKTDRYGIGSMRLKEVFQDEADLYLKMHDSKNVNVTAERPKWWPHDLKF